MIRPHLLSLLAILAVAPVAASASAAPTPMTEYDVARLSYATNGVISPDGREVAYLKQVQRAPFTEPDGPAWVELHVVDGESRSRPFVTGDVNVSSPAWTADGAHIAFVAKRPGDEHAALYLIPRDGGEARRAVKHATDLRAFSLAPDGERVAFLAERAQDEAAKKLAKEGFAQKIYEEDLRPTEVYVARLSPGDAAAAKPEVVPLPGSALDVAWSPKGDRLAVTLVPEPTVDAGYMKRRVHVVDVAKEAVVAQIDTVGKLGQVEWSPDGEQLALIGSADINDPAAGRLLVASASGGAARDLMPGYLGHVRSVAWRDARTVAFVADEGVLTTVAQIDANGKGKKVLVAPGGPTFRRLTLSRDGRTAAFYGDSPAHPYEVFYGKLGKAPRRLTDSNPWLGERRLAKQEVVRYAARDGVEIEGLLIRPLERRGDARVPLILVVHGGPESNFHHGWLTNYGWPGQVSAGRGFAVFYPNYRGSTGRGVAFSKLSQGDPAGKEFDDLVDGVDHLVASGLVDKARVGVTGGSYGGYATAWCSTYYSERFAAGVMFVGVSDKISKTGTTDIPEEEFLVHALRRPWDDWRFFLERSPIYHVQKARTPLLILHGDSDPRVHPGQSLELYRFLRILGKTPVRLVLYPGEGHGNRKAGGRLDYNLRSLRWLEHYLTGPGGAPPTSAIDYQRPPSDGAAPTTTHE